MYLSVLCFVEIRVASVLGMSLLGTFGFLGVLWCICVGISVGHIRRSRNAQS